MQFDERHLVVIDSLQPNEAQPFVQFLEWELQRHQRNIVEIQSREELFGETIDKLFESEIQRHQGDIIQTQELINQVILKFGEVKE